MSWQGKKIARELGVAQSSVSLWVRDIELPPEVPRRLLGRGGRARAARLREKAAAKSRTGDESP